MTSSRFRTLAAAVTLPVTGALMAAAGAPAHSAARPQNTTSADASVAILVTGSQRPFIQVQRALAQFEVEVIRVALVIDPDAQVGVRHAGGLTILTVRELGDLRRVLFSGALA